MKKIKIALLLFVCIWATTINSLSQTFNMTGTTTLTGSTYDMTPTVGLPGCLYQAGALWCTSTLDFTQPFELDFQASYDVVAGLGADGICVVFGQMGTTSLPVGLGGNLGYYGTGTTPFSSNSFAVEMDTYNNGTGVGDIASDHTAIVMNGGVMSFLPGAGAVQIDPGAANIKDAIFRNYRVTWSPTTQTMFVYCNCQLRITCHYDFLSNFTTPTTINWGFTGSTGGDCSRQKIKNISLNIPIVDTDTIVHCGPVTLTAPTGTLYYWFPSGLTTSTRTVFTSGTYHVVSYNASTCTVLNKTYYVTINPVPSILDNLNLCVDDSRTYTTGVSGCTWLSSNIAVATIGSTTGLVTGESPGTAIITCTSPAGCTDTATVFVHPIPGEISGPRSLCRGTTIILTNPVPGGTWSSSNTGVATIGSLSGVLDGVAPGTTIITYRLPGGCYDTAIITVKTMPAPIAGALAVCVGSTSALTNSVPGGTWSSTLPAIGSIVPLTGIVTGVSAGTTIITYMHSSGCYSTATFTVYAVPDPGIISGTSLICTGVGFTDATFTASVPGGVWSSLDITLLTDIGGGTFRAGVGSGVAIISYTVTGPGPLYCTATATHSVTVTSTPTPSLYTYALGVFVHCDTIAMLGTPGDLLPMVTSHAWSWSAITPGASIAWVDEVTTPGLSTKRLYGTGAGTVMITYTLSGPCGTAFATRTLEVGPIPTATITMPSEFCVGSTHLISFFPSGGVWSYSVPDIAVVDGIWENVTGVNAGTVTITHTVTFSPGCSIMATKTVTVNPLPAPIGGILRACEGNTTTLTDASPGGIWSSSNIAIAEVGSLTGIVTGVNAGLVYITYTLPTGCFTTALLTVYSQPGAITGRTTLCIGTTTSLFNSSPGGFWSSSDIAIATVGSLTGIVRGEDVGTAIITYSPAAGCLATTTVTVISSPDILGPTSVCIDATITLTSSTGYGTWSSSNVGVATIGSLTGLVTGVTAGTTIITYRIDDGCLATMTLTVNPLPVLDLWEAPTAVCVGERGFFLAVTPGGLWSSSNEGIATIGSLTGIVTGVSAGTCILTYTLGTGCFVTVPFTVMPLPLPITGVDIICVGGTTTLSDATPGGSWSTTYSEITIDPITGLVTGISAGTAIVTYRSPIGCYVTDTVTVNPLPTVPAGISLCMGSTTTISGSGGIWSGGDIDIATVGSISGDVTGVGVGTTVITYTLPTGCSNTVTVTVNPMPSVITTLTDTICVGSTTTLSNAVSGGIWTSGNIAVATVGSLTGIVTGVSAGTAIITYMLGAGCYVMDTITVNPLPTISGSLSLCLGYTTTLFGTGGIWSSSDIGIATVGSTSGVVTGTGVGTAVITYTLPTGCLATTTITVNPIPSPILSPSDTLCVGATMTLIDTTLGGIWSSSDIGIATVGSTTGIITGISTGSVVITYSIGTGCFVLDTVFIHDAPVVPAITGLDTACIGGTTTLSNAFLGGIWTSSNTGVATVGSSTGIVTGVTAGTAIISYSVTNECGTTVVTDTVAIVAAYPPIFGKFIICSGVNDTLYHTISGGVWSSSNIAVATVGSSTGIVIGVSSGTATITYISSSPCGTYTVTATVFVDIPSFITTNTIVACQTLISPGGDGTPISPGTLLPGTGCQLVCDSSIVRYYGNAAAGSTFDWVVTGGDIVADYGDSIDVFWHGVGSIGRITFYDTAGHCTGEASGCIQIIAKPHANFSASSISICNGDEISFTDLSTADSLSPIISWYWNFGDGFGTSIRNPSHTYTTVGTHTVTLVVKNACNCADTFTIDITVSSTPGPKITCASVVCENELATYSTTANTCGIYLWSVIGGSIITGGSTSTAITVKWDAIGSDGFGYVKLVQPCADCTDTTTIKIPVILQNATIEGPSVVCAGEQYEFSLPLWGATQYNWGVLGLPIAVVGYRDDHKVIVNFPGPGTYTVHGWYQNRIKLCGGNVTKTVIVLPRISIAGITSLCQNDFSSYSIPAMYTGKWMLSDSTGTPVDSLIGTSVYAHTYTVPGVYYLSVSGAFCSAPLTIVVKALPPIVDSIVGPDTVCMNRVYSYTAYKHDPGVTFNWSIVGGNLTPGSGADEVTVVWTSPGIKKLTVNLESILPPHCAGPGLVKVIVEDPIDPNITSSGTACANGYHSYTSNYGRGEVYDWQILPNIAGSVVSGNHGPDILVQWNDYSGTPKIVVSVRKCDRTVNDTLIVTVDPMPALSITSSGVPICPLAVETFTASPGAGSYYWSWGDGTTSTTTSNVTTHWFPENTTTGNMVYHVTLLATVGSGPCSPFGFASLDVAILPGPVAYLSSGDYLTLCPYTSAFLVGTVTDNVGGGLTYEWSNGAIIPGATNSTYTEEYDLVPREHNIYFVVTASNGCRSWSNSLRIRNEPECGGTSYVDTGSGGIGGGGGHCMIPVVATNSCNTVTLAAAAGTGDIGTWTADITPASGPLPLFTPTVTATYDKPGVYKFRYVGSYGGCHVDSNFQDTVGIVVNYRWRIKCGSGGMDSIILQDYTAHVTWWNVDSIAWYDGATRIGGGSNLGLYYAAPGTYNIRQVAYGTSPGRRFTCDLTQTIVVPSLPSATFTTSVSPVCEKVPVAFTPTTSVGVVGYNWAFGDGASSLLQFTKRTYDWTGAAIPQRFPATLTVVDNLGCTAIDSQDVEIYPNRLNGNLGIPTLLSVCSSDAPVILSWTNAGIGTIVQYQWSNGVTNTTGFDTVNKSGAYWVTVFDNHQCQKTLPFPNVKQVKIVKPPHPQIYGKKNYCQNDVVQLYGYAGTKVTYEWKRNGATFSTASSIADVGLSPGTYFYQLKIGVLDTATGLLCYDTSEVDTIHIHLTPPVPTITGPDVVDCNTYHLQLTASVAEAGFYNWSNGGRGAVNNIFTGGPYRVWFTDMNGCVSHNDKYVPNSPESYFPYFATGCYSLCVQQLPLKLFGPPDALFTSWDWLYNGSSVSSGSGLMNPYIIDTPLLVANTYTWALNNGLCTKTSGDMNISLVECNACQQQNVDVSILCTSGNPASYSMSIAFVSPGAGTYTLGTDIGPIVPFSGMMAGSGYISLSLTFTTLYLPPPDSVTVQVSLVMEDGSRCFFKKRVKLPECGWTAERRANTDTAQVQPKAIKQAATAMLVFPNPASSEVTISYEYGSAEDNQGNGRTLTIYDAMGRTMTYTVPEELHGSWKLNTSDWASGIYLIRMEGNGRTLQVQRIVINR